MIQGTFRIVATEGKLEEFRNVLLCLKGPTEGLAECHACWICQDVADDHVLTYLVQWDSQQDLEAHLCSERFRRLLPYIEMSAEPPLVSIGSIEGIRGIEFLVEVLTTKTH
jgi:quinol monooxygenase YgiN